MTLSRKWFGAARDKSDRCLREIAAALGLENATVSFDGVPTCTLAHEGLSSGIDLRLDLEQKKRAVVELEKVVDPPTGSDDAVHLGGGLLCAREDIPAYRHLPEGLRARMLTEMSEGNLVRLRAGPSSSLAMTRLELRRRSAFVPSRFRWRAARRAG